MSANSSFDPQLKRAREEIDAVLQKYGAGGAVVLVRPGERLAKRDMSVVWTEQWIHLADWMMASFSPEGALLLHLRKSERERTEQTMGAFRSFIDAMGPWTVGLMDAVEQIEAEQGTVHEATDFLRDV